MDVLTCFLARVLWCTDRCTVDIDDCESQPCQNDGLCNDRVNGYECNCTTNYTGPSCEYDVREHSTDFVYFPE